jgi:hypothetical protein
MSIVSAVHHMAAFAAMLDKPGEPQLRKMLRNRGRCCPENRSNLAHRMLAIEEAPQETHPRGVRKHREGRSRNFDLLTRELS